MAFKMRSKFWKSGPMKPTSKLSVDIPDAASRATRFITELTNGIFVHAEGKGPNDTQAPTGWSMLDALEYIMEGVTRFWVGVKQGASNVTMRFGVDTESHMELDYRSMQMVDREGSTYFHVNDLRDEHGCAELEERFVGDGSNDTFYTTFSIDQRWGSEQNPVEPYVDGDLVTLVSVDMSLGKVVLETAPPAGSEVLLVYNTSDARAKALTFGSRGDSAAYATGGLSVAIGSDAVASGNISYARGEGFGYSDATWEDHGPIASGYGACADGEAVIASGAFSHAEGRVFEYREEGTVSMTRVVTEAAGNASHAEGMGCRAEGKASHAEGAWTTAANEESHAEGYHTTSLSYGSHSEGMHTVAGIQGNQGSTGGWGAHAEGWRTVASGEASHAQNGYTVAASYCQTALGKYNEEDTNDKYAVIVGNGTSDTDRSNALGVWWDGTVDMGPYLHIDSEDYDVKSATNGVTANFWPSMQVRDKNDLRSSLVGSQVYADGKLGTGMWAYNYNSSGTQVGSGAFLVNVDKSGGVTYSFSKTPMREAMGTHAYGRYEKLTATQTLAASWEKVSLSTFAGSGCSASASGIKAEKAGTYMVWASAYMTSGYTVNDIIHFAIYKNAGKMFEFRTRAYAAAPYETVNIGPTFFDLAAGDVVYLYAYNQIGARGLIGSEAMHGLYIRQIA